MKARIARFPKIKLNQDLPVTQYADRLIDAIQQHQVIIVAGETGSGKTTQLPQIAMLAGRGATGMITILSLDVWQREVSRSALQKKLGKNWESRLVLKFVLMNRVPMIPSFG